MSLTPKRISTTSCEARVSGTELWSLVRDHLGASGEVLGDVVICGESHGGQEDSTDGMRGPAINLSQLDIVFRWRESS